MYVAVMFIVSWSNHVRVFICKMYIHSRKTMNIKVHMETLNYNEHQ